MPPAINQLTNNPWAREHDEPGVPVVPSAALIQFPTGAFPQALQQVMQICSQQGVRRTVAGSHWALSTAAVSDNTFVETHDPGDSPTQLFPAMGRTLFDVVPGCLTGQFLQTLAAQTPPPYDVNHVVGVDNFAGADVTVSPTPGTYFVHCETGKRIFQLYAELDQGDDLNPQSLAVLLKTNFGNPSYLGPWAFETLGGAGGQTVFGALTTGTHGGDFGLPPIADAVEALHLVTDGGAHFWIERSPDSNRPLQLATSDPALNQLYGAIAVPGSPPPLFTIIRDDDHFNTVLVAAGRFGIVYSVVLRVVRQYSLHFDRSLSTWQQVKGQIADPNSALFLQPPSPPGVPPRSPQPCKFLQIAVCATPQQNFTANLCGVTKQWNSPMVPEVGSPTVPFGRPERVGVVVAAFDPIIGGPRFSNAGNSLPLSPNPNQPDVALPPSFLFLACENASFMAGVVNAVKTDIQNFVTSQAAPIGGTIATIAAVSGGGLLATLLALIPFLAAIIPLLETFLTALQNDPQTRLGQALNDLRLALLNSPNPQLRAAGLLAWQGIANAVFASQQSVLNYAAISYAVHDGWNYLDLSCSVDADSIEVFFDATDPKLIAFVDALLVFEIRQENLGKAFAGYISLRFTGETAALLGMEQFARTCSVEVSGLRDVNGSTALIDFALTLALNPNFGGILHWGQRNTATMDDIQRTFGDAPGQPSGNLHTWRGVLSELTDNGRLDGFSSEFTRQVGLEIVSPLIRSFALRQTPIANGPVLLDWDCSHNPPPPRTTAQISWTAPSGATGSQSVGLSGSSQQIITATETGVYQFVLTATVSLNGESRQTTQTLSVTVP